MIKGHGHFEFAQGKQGWLDYRFDRQRWTLTEVGGGRHCVEFVGMVASLASGDGGFGPRAPEISMEYTVCLPKC